MAVYQIHKVKIYHIKKLCAVGKILYRCGRDMAESYDLQHWNNSWVKTVAVVGLCALKSKIYLVCNDAGKAVATFQVNQQGDKLHFSKLATDPANAGKGVGTFCMETIERMAQEMGCGKVCCEVYDKSRHAIAFYEKKGYAVTGTCSSMKYTQLQMEKTVGENG